MTKKTLFTCGIIDASATLKCSIPWTLRSGLTTAMGSVEGPILQVPAWWFSGRVSYWIRQSQCSELPFLPTFLHSGASLIILVKWYFFNAFPFTSFKIFWIPCWIIFLSIGSARSLPQMFGGLNGSFDASVIRPENHLYLIAMSRTFIPLRKNYRFQEKIWSFFIAKG